LHQFCGARKISKGMNSGGKRRVRKKAALETLADGANKVKRVRGAMGIVAVTTRVVVNTHNRKEAYRGKSESPHGKSRRGRGGGEGVTIIGSLLRIFHGETVVHNGTREEKLSLESKAHPVSKGHNAKNVRIGGGQRGENQ